MTPREMARALGRKGGRARAARLTPAERKRIAALGGQARKASLDAARRIDRNFDYLAALDHLRPPAAVVHAKTFAGPLPGIRRADG